MSFKSIMEKSDTLKNNQDNIPSFWDKFNENSYLYQLLKNIEREFNILYETMKDTMNSHFINIEDESPIEEPININSSTESEPILIPGGMSLIGSKNEWGEFKGTLGSFSGIPIGIYNDEPERLYRQRIISMINYISGSGTAESIKKIMEASTKRLDTDGTIIDGIEPEIMENFFPGAKWGTDTTPPELYDPYWFYWGNDTDNPDGNSWLVGEGEIPPWTYMSSDATETELLTFACNFKMTIDNYNYWIESKNKGFLITILNQIKGAGIKAYLTFELV